MNIEISAKEYVDLLDILHIAEVAISRHRREEDKRTERHRALMQKIYARAKDEGLSGLIGYNDNSKKYSPTPEFEQTTIAHALIDEFGEHVFWDQLIDRLTVRDAAQIAGGMERVNAMSDSERRNVEGAVRQHYIEEFATNGVANLRVREMSGITAGHPVKTSD